MRLKISNYTMAFVYVSLFAMALMWAAAGCGPGPTSYNIPDFYSPAFTRLSPEVVQSTDTVNITSGVRIKVNDNSGAPTVQLFAKKYGEKDYKSFTMSATDSIYSYHLPADYVSFEYYFSATDGLNSVTLPANAPTSVYSRLIGVPAVYGDKYYGVSPALVARPNTVMTFEVEVVSDTALEAGYPKINWREIGGSTAVLAMTATADALSQGVKYAASIPAGTLLDGRKYEYQIEVLNTASTTHGAYTVYYPGEGRYNAFEINSTTNLPPVAKVKYDTTKKYFITTDTSGASDVLLDGSESSDPEDGQVGLIYTWSQVSGPKVTVKSTTTSPLAYFTPMTIGTYSFSLKIQDKNGNNSNTAVTSPDIEVTNSVIPSQSIPQYITTEVVLQKASSPFTVTAPITVGAGGRLKIERGVELKFETGAGFFVQTGGVINADGDAANVITMKSNLPVIAKGQWEGIRIETDQGYPASTLNYCNISSAKTAIYVKDSKNPTISNCTITECYDGVYSDNSAVTITQNAISGCGTDGVVCINGSVSTISNNSISKNKRYGIHCNASKSEISKNMVSENNYGLIIANSLRAAGQVVNVFGNKLYKNTDGLRIETSDPVISSNDIYLNNDNGILCRNSLPQITSNGIHNNRDSGIQMTDCNYRSGTGALVNRSAASLYSCEVEIAHNVISFSGADGIELEASNPIINHNIIAANANTGIYVKTYGSAIASEATGVLIINNIISQNARAGISRNGQPPGPSGNYFANMTLMINNNDFIANSQEYTDVTTGRDLSGDSKEIYFNSPFFDEDTGVVSFTGRNFNAFAKFADANGAITNHQVFTGGQFVMMLHTQTLEDQRSTGTTFNDGRNIRSDPKLESYSTMNTASGALENPLASLWRLRDIASYPRMGRVGIHNIVDGSEGDVSLLINSGTSYSAYGANPNTDIGLLRWIGTIYETLK